MVRRLARLQNLLRAPLAVTAFVAGSSRLQTGAVAEALHSVGVALDDVARVDDAFFDFSAYAVASARFVDRDVAGAIFVNDTLADKHGSDHLVRKMAQTITLARMTSRPFPLLIGPFRHSEFSVGDRAVDEFVSTFFFFLNAPGIAAMAVILAQLPAVRDALTSGAGDDRIDPALLRICMLHGLQLGHRFTGESGQAALACKLSTAYMERTLTARVKSAGVVWYVASGLAGRLLVPWQSRLTRAVASIRDRLGVSR